MCGAIHPRFDVSVFRLSDARAFFSDLDVTVGKSYVGEFKQDCLTRGRCSLLHGRRDEHTLLSLRTACGIAAVVKYLTREEEEEIIPSATPCSPTGTVESLTLMEGVATPVA